MELTNTDRYKVLTRIFENSAGKNQLLLLKKYFYDKYPEDFDHITSLQHVMENGGIAQVPKKDKWFYLYYTVMFRINANVKKDC
jgi:hypothetical protein